FSSKVRGLNNECHSCTCNHFIYINDQYRWTKRNAFFHIVVFKFCCYLTYRYDYARSTGNPLILTAIACAIISCINLFFINEINSKTITAFISTIFTISILLFFIYLTTKKTMIQGFGEEEIEEISIFSLYLGVDFVKISASVIIMSTIGAITDVAISITSPMFEIYHQHPTISQKELFKSGMSIGKDILGSNTNTLFFAFIGGYLGLLIWFKDLSY